MPLGPEQGPGYATYDIWFTHPDLGPEGSTIQFELHHTRDGDSTEEERDTMIQKLVDLIDGSPDFAFQNASKRYEMNRPITPTT